MSMIGIWVTQWVMIWGDSLGHHGKAHIVHFINEDVRGKEAEWALLYNLRM